MEYFTELRGKECNEDSKLVVFEDKKIRRIFHNGEWYFSIVDVIRILAGTTNPGRYWPELKKQFIENEGFVQLLGKIEQLKLVASGGVSRFSMSMQS